MRIGIDFGGTKIEFIALSDDGTVLSRGRVATPRDDYTATIEAIRRGVLDIEQGSGVPSLVGIGIPGSISPSTGLVRGANSTWLIGKPFGVDLEAAMGRPVRLENDANCFTLSEALDGAAAGAGTVFGVILGTGVGGGIVIDGKPWGGHNGIAGEWGHNPLPWAFTETQSEHPSPPNCYCGKQGCIETYLSGPGLSLSYRLISGQIATAVQVAERANSGDNAAEDALGRYERRLARALATVINLFDPDVIVLGGGLSQIDRLYRNIPSLWREWVFADHVETVLKPPKFGDSSGVRGAAWLWPLA
jgi:fructokinase